MSVEIEHVEKFYGKNQVLKDINMTIKSTGCYAILGPKGAGKTTLFRVLSTLSIQITEVLKSTVMRYSEKERRL